MQGSKEHIYAIWQERKSKQLGVEWSICSFTKLLLQCSLPLFASIYTSLRSAPSHWLHSTAASLQNLGNAEASNMVISFLPMKLFPTHCQFSSMLIVDRFIHVRAWKSRSLFLRNCVANGLRSVFRCRMFVSIFISLCYCTDFICSVWLSSKFEKTSQNNYNSEYY